MSEMNDWNRRVIEEFRANGGEVGGDMAGWPIVLVHHRGAKTGTERVTPVVYQQLDGARHDKLLRQMQRATSLPLVLADAGMAPEAGRVYLVPGELGIATGGDGARFAAGAHAFAQLTPGDNAIVVLSGADPALVDAIMAQSWAGALVLAQLPSGCYEPAAAQALIARGVASDTPQHLASQLARRWPEHKGPEA